MAGRSWRGEDVYLGRGFAGGGLFRFGNELPLRFRC